ALPINVPALLLLAPNKPAALLVVEFDGLAVESGKHFCVPGVSTPVGACLSLPAHLLRSLAGLEASSRRVATCKANAGASPTAAIAFTENGRAPPRLALPQQSHISICRTPSRLALPFWRAASRSLASTSLTSRLPAIAPLLRRNRVLNNELFQGFH